MASKIYKPHNCDSILIKMLLLMSEMPQSQITKCLLKLSLGITRMWENNLSRHKHDFKGKDH